MNLNRELRITDFTTTPTSSLIKLYYGMEEVREEGKITSQISYRIISLMVSDFKKFEFIRMNGKYPLIKRKKEVEEKKPNGFRDFYNQNI